MRQVTAYPVEKQPSSSEWLLSSSRRTAVRDHSLNINAYVKINYPGFFLSDGEVGTYLIPRKVPHNPLVAVRVEEFIV